MIPVRQKTHNDCLRACIASLTELPLDEVPHFLEHEDWRGCLNAWCEKYNLVPLDVTLEAPLDLCTIAIVPSPNFKRGKHAVIWKGNRLIHDPLGPIESNYEPEEHLIFVVKDLAKFIG
ncbi:MAG: hypothetical protein ACTSQE_17430, partial [Candidatus Heimdallarchaeaceae archaeon]